MWTEEERRKRRKTFTLDFPGEIDSERATEMLLDNMDVSPTPSHRHRSRTKPISTKSPHRNNKRRDSIPQQIIRSPQKEEWREQTEDAGHGQTSDDSSCSHHYHHVHHHHHHRHRESGDGGTHHRRTRESPRRKTGSYVSSRRRSNEVVLIFDN